MVYYRSGELLDVAIRLEIAGKSFYQELQKKADRQEQRDLFAYLADEEQKHRELFEQLKQKTGVFRTEFGYDLEDYHMGLSLLEDSAVFRKDEEAISLARHAKSANEALDAAIRFEKDSILYYQEMRPIMAPEFHGVLDRVVNEEKIHFRKLSGMRKGQ